MATPQARFVRLAETERAHVTIRVDGVEVPALAGDTLAGRGVDASRASPAFGIRRRSAVGFLPHGGVSGLLGLDRGG